MSSDETWAAHQLELGLAGQTAPPMSETTARKVVESLQEILFLAAVSLPRHAGQETSDED